MTEPALILQNDRSAKATAANFLHAACDVAHHHKWAADERRAIHTLSGIAAQHGMNYRHIETAAGLAILAQKTMRSLHGDQGMKTYPLVVALSVVHLNLDKGESVVAALLHEAVARKLVTLSDIHNSFGDEQFASEAAGLTDEVARITSMGRQLRLGGILEGTGLSEEDYSFNQAQMEIGQEGLCSFPSSSRVVPIKLFDCLHGIRSVEFDKKPEDRLRRVLFADRTYMPLARYYGWDGIREELERSTMKELDPDASEYIAHHMGFFRRDRQMLARLEAQLERTYGVNSPINKQIRIESSRVKSDYAVWRKMLRKQNEIVQAKIKNEREIVREARDAGLDLELEERIQNMTFSYKVDPEQFDNLFTSVNDKIGARISVVGGTDADVRAVMQRIGERYAIVSGSAKDKTDEPRNRYREIQYKAVHGAYLVPDEKLGIPRVEIQAYSSDDAQSNFNDHRAYKGRKGLVIPEIPTHLAQRRSYLAFQDAALVTSVANRTVNRMAGGAPPATPFTPRHIVTVGNDGAFVLISVKSGANSKRMEYPTIGDFIFTVSTRMASHVVSATVQGVEWNLRPEDLEAYQRKHGWSPMDLNLITGDHIDVKEDPDMNDLSRYMGHLRWRRNRESLSRLLKVVPQGPQ